MAPIILSTSGGPITPASSNPADKRSGIRALSARGELEMERAGKNKSKHRAAKPIVITIAVILAIVASAFGIQRHQRTAARDAEQTQARQAAADEAASEKAEAEEEQYQRQAEERRKASLASIHFDADPHNEIPVMSLDEMTRRLYDKRNPLELELGQAVRIVTILTEDNIYHNSLHFMLSPADFLYQNYDFTIPDYLLNSLQPGDEVEFLVYYDGEKDDSVEGRYESFTMYFHGMEIQKVPQ